LGAAAEITARAREQEINLRQDQRQDAIEMDTNSREAIRVTLATVFPGIYDKTVEAGITWKTMDSNGAQMVAAMFMQEAANVEQDLDKMQEKLDGIQEIRRNLYFKNQAAAAKAGPGGLSLEAKTSQDVNTMHINDALKTSERSIMDQMDKLRRAQQVQREGEEAVAMEERTVELMNRQAQINSIYGSGVGGESPPTGEPPATSGIMGGTPASSNMNSGPPNPSRR
jgi:hypothetical protein